MSVLDMFNTPLTEAPRLDAVIREHDDLQRKFNALVRMLRERNLISQDEVAKLMADAVEPSGRGE